MFSLVGLIAEIFISLKITILTTNTSLDLCSHFLLSELTGHTHMLVIMSLRTISFRELRVLNCLDIVDSQPCIIAAVTYRICIAELSIHDV